MHKNLVFMMFLQRLSQILLCNKDQSKPVIGLTWTSPMQVESSPVSSLLQFFELDLKALVACTAAVVHPSSAKWDSQADGFRWINRRVNKFNFVHFWPLICRKTCVLTQMHLSHEV